MMRINYKIILYSKFIMSQLNKEELDFFIKILRKSALESKNDLSEIRKTLELSRKHLEEAENVRLNKLRNVENISNGVDKAVKKMKFCDEQLSKYIKEYDKLTSVESDDE